MDIIAKVSKGLVDQLAPDLADAGRLLTELIEEAAYVGDVYSLSYAETLVQVHDFHRAQVGGVPALSFLQRAGFNSAVRSMFARRTPPFSFCVFSITPTSRMLRRPSACALRRRSE
jgi:hypothetical protein